MTKFEVFEIALELIQALRPAVSAIALRDRDLAEQLRRAASSVPLNISEGARRTGKDRQHSYRIAAGSAAEASAALSVAQAWGYIDLQAYHNAHQLADRILAMLWRLTQPR